MNRIKLKILAFFFIFTFGFLGFSLVNVAQAVEEACVDRNGDRLCARFDISSCDYTGVSVSNARIEIEKGADSRISGNVSTDSSLSASSADGDDVRTGSDTVGCSLDGGGCILTPFINTLLPINRSLWGTLPDNSRIYFTFASEVNLGYRTACGGWNPNLCPYEVVNVPVSAGCNFERPCGVDTAGECGAAGGCSSQTQKCLGDGYGDYECVEDSTCEVVGDPSCTIAVGGACDPRNTTECCQGGAACNAVGEVFFCTMLPSSDPPSTTTDWKTNKSYYEGPIFEYENFLKAIYGILLPVGIGLIAVPLIILNGYKIMTSQGDPSKVMAGKEGLTSAIIGTLFILLSLWIIRIVIESFLQ